MSVAMEGNPGCSALGHLYQANATVRVCITCGHVEGTPATTEPTTQSPNADGQ